MNTTQITIRGNVVANLGIEPTMVNGDGGPRCPRLVIPINIQSRSAPPWALDYKIMSLIALQCSLCTDSISNFIFAEGSKLLGTYLSPESSQNIELSIPLDPYRLKELERYRSSGDLKLRLVTELIVLLPSGNDNRLKEDSNRPRLLLSEIFSIREKINFEIPRSIWIERILPNLKDSNTELIEVPLGKGRLQEAYRYLEVAEEAYHRWDTKSVYVHCREMATALDRIVRQRLSSDKFSVEERWNRAYERFNNLASLDLHLEDIKKSTAVDAQQVIIDRRDADFVLLSAKILLKYANELLPEE